MELRHLRAFVTLAEELHFGRAAERLGIAQPPLSMQIQGLEATLGVRLFNRSRRHVELTEAGRLFLPEAKATLAQAERARQTAQRAARGEMGELNIGFTGSAPFNIALPKIISRFRQRWPDLLMRLREMSTFDQIGALAEGELDVGFVRPSLVERRDNIALHTVLNERLLAVVPADHPLAGQDSISIGDLAGDSFILHPRQIGTGLYDKVMDLCARAGFRPQVVLEAHQMSTIVSLTAAGVGVSIAPEAMSSIHVEGARFLPLTDEGAVMVLAIATRADDQRPAIGHFLDEVAAFLRWLEEHGLSKPVTDR